MGKYVLWGELKVSGLTGKTVPEAGILEVELEKFFITEGLDIGLAGALR